MPGSPPSHSGGEKRKPGRPATGRTKMGISVRARPEWVAWINETAEARGLNSAELIHQALAIAAKRWKIGPPPDRI